MNKKIVLLALLLLTSCSKGEMPIEKTHAETIAVDSTKEKNFEKVETVTLKPDKNSMMGLLKKGFKENTKNNIDNIEEVSRKSEKLEEDKFKQQEEKKTEEEKRKSERLAEERRKQEEQRKAEEQKRIEDERKKIEEEKKKKIKNSISYNGISYPIRNGGQAEVDGYENKWINISPIYENGTVEKYVGDGRGLYLAAHGDSEIGIYMRDNLPSFIFTDKNGNQQKYSYYGYMDTPQGDFIYGDDPFYPWLAGNAGDYIVFQICNADSNGRGIAKSYVFAPVN